MKFDNLFHDMICNDPKDIMKIKLTPLEKTMALCIIYKNNSQLTDHQKIMLFQDAKLSTLWILKNRNKK